MNKDLLERAIYALDIAQALLEKSSHHKTILSAYTELREYVDTHEAQRQAGQEPNSWFVSGPKLHRTVFSWGEIEPAVSAMVDTDSNSDRDDYTATHIYTAPQPAASQIPENLAIERQAGQEPKGRVTESIWSGAGRTIPLAEVQHIETRPGEYLMIVMKSSTYNAEQGEYNNAPCLGKEEGKDFTAAWCRYRSELEADTLMNLSPQPTKGATHE